MNSKYNILQKELQKVRSAIIAFSGGVDSAFLLAISKKILKDQVVAVTAMGPHYLKEDQIMAADLAQDLGIRHIKIPLNLMTNQNFCKNTQERCYICKFSLFEKLTKLKKEIGFHSIFHGETVSDIKKDRPGRKAAKEWNVQAPLITSGFVKPEIRLLSKELGLPSWNLPSRSCRATRIETNTIITLERLQQIETAEQFLTQFGFEEYRIRLNCEGNARLEFSKESDMIKSIRYRKQILKDLQVIGFKRIGIDLAGYQSNVDVKGDPKNYGEL